MIPSPRIIMMIGHINFQLKIGIKLLKNINNPSDIKLMAIKVR